MGRLASVVVFRGVEQDDRTRLNQVASSIVVRCFMAFLVTHDKVLPGSFALDSELLQDFSRLFLHLGILAGPEHLLKHGRDGVFVLGLQC